MEDFEFNLSETPETPEIPEFNDLAEVSESPEYPDNTGDEEDIGTDSSSVNISDNNSANIGITTPYDDGDTRAPYDDGDASAPYDDSYGRNITETSNANTTNGDSADTTDSNATDISNGNTSDIAGSDTTYTNEPGLDTKNTRDVTDAYIPRPFTAADNVIHTGDELRPENIEPNSTYERNGYEYATDDLGRTRTVSADLRLEEGHRSHLQTEIGHTGIDGDEGGHLIGTRYDGPTDAFNLVPQNSNLNRGDWKAMENSWASALEEGRDVKVMIDPIYTGNATRPDSFDVLTQIDGELTYSSFLNKPKEGTEK